MGGLFRRRRVQFNAQSFEARRLYNVVAAGRGVFDAQEAQVGLLSRPDHHDPSGVGAGRRQHVESLSLGAGIAAGRRRRRNRPVRGLALKTQPHNCRGGRNRSVGGDELDIHQVSLKCKGRIDPLPDPSSFGSCGCPGRRRMV